MEHAFDLVPEASLGARLGGEAIGLANLGLRDSEGWVGGIGIVPAHRGRRHGETLMRALLDAARERGVQRLWLEVIVENTSAVKLYEKLGFAHVRELEVWSLPGEATEVGTAEAAAARAWLACRTRDREPWQRADGTVARLSELDPAPAALVVEGGAALVRVNAGRVSILQLAGESARGLGESVLLLNLPANDDAASALRGQGGDVVVRQHEMVLAL